MQKLENPKDIAERLYGWRPSTGTVCRWAIVPGKNGEVMRRTKVGKRVLVTEHDFRAYHEDAYATPPKIEMLKA
ncbi:MAG: hypothetical protein SGI77_23525 [Pirellulaceae bacterium]|nr:hypothetical protein [Pirellulaceae bacterium]